MEGVKGSDWRNTGLDIGVVSTGPGREPHQEALPGDRTAHGTGAAPSYHGWSWARGFSSHTGWIQT